MGTFILPAPLDPANYVLALTPGTYSELVLDTLGDTDFSQDATLAQADDAEVLLSNAADGPEGADDSIAALGTAQGRITQGNGGAIAAQLAPAIAATGAAVVNYGVIVPADPGKQIPGQPVIGQPVGSPAGFVAAQVESFGDVSVAIGGGTAGGAPGPNDYITAVLTGIQVGVEFDLLMPSTLLVPGANEPVQTNMKVGSDPSIQATNTGQGSPATFYVVLKILATQAGTFRGSITCVHASAPGPQDWGIYYTAS